jgi:alpha-N-acetylglucosaminidase
MIGHPNHGHSVLTFASILVGWILACPAMAATPAEAARGLVQRLAPQHVDQFLFEMIPEDNGRDVFELESRDGRIVVRGSSGVVMASGWNWYLKYYCRCHVSLWGNQLKLPDPLPAVPQKVRHVSPFKYRYYLNYCAFSYSIAWYDWPQWERLIDWMAMHGINMPLAVTGQEAILQKVYRDLGLNDRQIADFFVGPGYLPFGWMGCIDGWGGPLPKSWIDSHLELQKKIVARQRELGMTPVLQGFTGHVPAALKEVVPEAKLERLPSWCGFPPTHFLNPQDPLFVQIGKRFLEEQTRQFGTNHYYASDTFIEMQPPSKDPQFLAQMAKGVYEAMRAGDPEAVWIMQGWIFVNSPDFWQPPQAKAFLDAVPDDRMVLLDLACEDKPVWNKTEAFHGKPWIWSVIQDYGDVVSMHGGLPQIAANLREAMTSPQAGRLVGIGLVNEGLGNNPVVNDYLGEMTWRSDVPEIAGWVQQHVASRYGSSPPAAAEAWRLLLDSVYRTPGDAGGPICTRPSWDGMATARVGHHPYDPRQLALAWQKLLECSSQLGDADTYRFDLVHVNRQVLSNLAVDLRREAGDAFQHNDRKRLADASGRFLQLIRDMDELLATREELLLGRWIENAKRWGTTEDERRLYEWNARTIITLWGAQENQAIDDYANKQWAGLLTDFYLPRWERFFQQADAALAGGKPFDIAACQQASYDWELQWTRKNDPYPATPRGDAVAVSRRLWNEYGKYFNKTEDIRNAKPPTGTRP